MSVTVPVDILERVDTTANWTAQNPVLDNRIAAFDSTVRKFKIGDGVTAWIDLPYWGGSDTVNPIIHDVPAGTWNPISFPYDGSAGSTPTRYVELINGDGSISNYTALITISADKTIITVTVADDGYGYCLDHYQLVIKV